MDIIEAANLNNEALGLEAAGDYDGAEKRHLMALELKKNSVYAKPTIIAVTENGLGELYLKMGKLDQAQKMLESAYQTRSRKCITRSHFDYSIADANVLLCLRLRQLRSIVYG